MAAGLTLALLGPPAPGWAQGVQPAFASATCAPHWDEQEGFSQKTEQGGTNARASCRSLEGSSRSAAVLGLNGYAEASASGSNNTSSAGYVVSIRIAPKAPPPFDPARIGVDLVFAWALNLSGRAGGSVHSAIFEVGAERNTLIAEPVAQARSRAPGQPPLRLLSDREGHLPGRPGGLSPAHQAGHL